jgi:RimJ/RimL family protein N-acetyltransferase
VTAPADVRAGSRIASDWPLFGLRISTERLELRPPNDDEIAELARVARLGIHGDDVMPFANGWTDYPEREFGRRFAQYFWSQRAGWRVDSWALPFAVFVAGEPAGVQQVTANAFPVLRTVGTGSWLARVHQRRGIGSEMRAALLHFAFEALDADVAITGAYSYNAGSIAVSRKLGYEPNGTRRDIVRGAPADALLFRLCRERWLATARPKVSVEGFEACVDLFCLDGEGALGR